MGMSPEELQAMQEGMGQTPEEGQAAQPAGEPPVNEMPPPGAEGIGDQETPTEDAGEPTEEPQDLNGDGIPDEEHPQHVQQQQMGLADEPHLQEALDDESDLDPLEVLPEVALKIMDYIFEIRDDHSLNKNVQSTILNQQVQSLTQIIPLLPSFKELEAQATQAQSEADLQMKQQEHQMNLQMKMQEHQLNIAHKQQELEQHAAQHQLTLQASQQQHAIKLQESAAKGQQDIVQKEVQHRQQMQQQKQAAQLKPTNKEGSNHGKSSK